MNAGRYYDDELLDAGVKLYELRNALLHAKTAVIDEVWSTVGSTNMDFLSFSTNNDVNAIILSSRFAAEMEDMVARDLEQPDTIMKERWDKRPVIDRIR